MKIFRKTGFKKFDFNFRDGDLTGKERFISARVSFQCWVAHRLIL
jgi:hypothetical protein